MRRHYLTIQETQSLIEDNPVCKQYLMDLIHHSIQEKKISFRVEKFNDHFDCLKKLGLVKSYPDNVFSLEYATLPVCYVLTVVAEEMMQQLVPVDAVDALVFANSFCKLIRQPKVNHHWSGDLDMRLQAYILIWLHQVHNIDITSFIKSVTDDMKKENADLRSADLIYTYVFPYLNDDTERQFETIVTTEGARDSALQAVKDFGEINPAKAALLYKYAKSHEGAKYPALLTALIRGLFPSDRDRYLNEAIDLFKVNPVESMRTIAWIDYDSDEHVKTAFDFVTQQTNADIEYSRMLPALYTRLIENTYTPEAIKQECFRLLGELTKVEDTQLRGDLLWRTRLIKGRDKEKMELLPSFMNWGSMGILHDYFDNFDSPEPMFGLLRQAFLQHGMSVDLKLFEHPIWSQYHLHKEQFNQELLKLLTDDIAIIRFAGIRILTSGYGGSAYEVDFLQLDEKGQLRAIESLLPSPTNIEELMPLLMKLRKSPHDRVRSALESGLINLIAAYDYHVLDMAKEHLDLTGSYDKSLLDKLIAAYETFKEATDARVQIKELDPMENELRYVDLYYRLEREKQAEMMERATSQSIFGQLAKNTTIIRGSGYNTEDNPAIAMLATVGSSRLMDRRYSINPEAYEWNFRMNAMLDKNNEAEET